MKNLSFVLLLFVAMIVGMPAAEAVVRPVNSENTTTTVENKELTKKEMRQQRRMKRKETKKELKKPFGIGRKKEPRIPIPYYW